RDRRIAPRPPSQAPPCPPGSPVLARRRAGTAPRRRPRHRHHQPRPRDRHAGWGLPRGSLLPSVRHRDPRPPAPLVPRDDPRPRPALPRPVEPAVPAPAHAPVGPRRPDGGLSLARQYPGTGELRPAVGRPRKPRPRPGGAGQPPRVRAAAGPPDSPSG